MTSNRSRAASLVAVVPLALGLAACGDDDYGTSSGDDSGSGGDGTVEITTPGDGGEVGASFDVELSSSEDLGDTDTGKKHVHLYYDSGTDGDDYDVVTSSSFTVERDLGEGEHTITAALANADHSLTGAEDEVTVTVGAGGGGGEDTDDTVDDPYSSGY